MKKSPNSSKTPRQARASKSKMKASRASSLVGDVRVDGKKLRGGLTIFERAAVLRNAKKTTAA